MSYNSELQSNNADLQAILDAVNELPEADAIVTKANITAALGYTPSDPGQYAVSVKALGAKGDGSMDDTAIIQSALATYRKVYIPGGTYNVSGELVIRDNCQLELAQDVVLNFTQTSGNCITVNRSSWLRGNHATVFVPYAFTGHVVNVDTSVHTSQNDVPPWTHWDPQWKTARYLTDLNICKTDSYGIGQSTNGDSNGTAVYLSAEGSTISTFIWGLNFSGLRIAGSFEYGIRAQNYNDGWNHEMRIEAFIDACKVGVSLEDCNKVYFSGSIQPRAAADGTVYAQHGIRLIRSRDTELSGSRVWDWDENNTLWTADKTNVNQHIAMYGDCGGTILNDYRYHHIPPGFTDLRELIYTDTPANFDSLIILQEPFTRWFKPIDYHPFFYDGFQNKRLLLKAEQDALFQTEQIPQFTNKLPTAIDKNGEIFNEVGYCTSGRWEASDGQFYPSEYGDIGCTGFIECAYDSTIHFDGLKWQAHGWAGILVMDENLQIVTWRGSAIIMSGEEEDYHFGYEETETGFKIILKDRAELIPAKYVAINFLTAGLGNHLIVTVDEEITYQQAGALADGILVKGSNLIGMDQYERIDRMVTAISDVSTDEQYPSAKAVYDHTQSEVNSSLTKAKESGEFDGNDGVSPTVAVSKSGKVTTISITDASGTKTATINDGADGAPGKDGADGKDGTNGADGTSVTVSSVSENSTSGGTNVVTFSDGKKVNIKNGKDGKDGTNGTDGKTPVKGTDYFTAADKTEMLNSLLAALPTWTGGSY